MCIRDRCYSLGKYFAPAPRPLKTKRSDFTSFCNNRNDCGGVISVSYTHLDVYKRQQQGRVNAVMVQSLDRLSHDITTLYRILRFLGYKTGRHVHQRVATLVEHR